MPRTVSEIRKELDEREPHFANLKQMANNPADPVRAVLSQQALPTWERIMRDLYEELEEAENKRR